MRISRSILNSPGLFRWLAAGAAVFALLLSLAGGTTSIWIMKNVTAGSEARQLADHLRAELWDRLAPADLQPPLSPKAVAALEYLFRRSPLSRAENLKELRLWSAEEKLLWASNAQAGGSAPSPDGFREALRHGFAFQMEPPNTLFPTFRRDSSPLCLVVWMAATGTDGEPPGNQPRFVIEARSEPTDLPAEIASYEIRLWLISGILGLVGLSLIFVSLSFLRHVHSTISRQAARGLLTSKITRVLSADLDPDRLFRDILREICQAVPCERIVIAGVDPSTREQCIWHVESSLPVPPLRPDEAREAGDWYLEHAYSPMRPVNLPDLEKVDAVWAQPLLKAGLHSSFILPIRQDEGKGHRFIHLGLSWTRKGGVDAEGEALLSSLAGHLGSAVRNAALFQKAETRASRLATLNVLSRKITQNIDLQETLEAIVHAAVELLGGDIARAFLLDEETGVLIPQAHAGRIPAPSVPPGTLRVGRGVIGGVVESGEPVILADVQQISGWQLTDWAQENNLRSYIVHPLRLGGKPFGAIYCLSTKPGFFTQEDLELLGSFSFQASIAIEKARLFAETRQRAVRLELAGEITKALASTIRPEELFHTIVREIRRAVPCERFVIGSLSKETRELHAWHFESEIDLPLPAGPYDTQGTWWDRDVYELKRLVNYPDIGSIPHPRIGRMTQAGVRSVLVMPILQDGECVAHIFLASVRAANFTRDHERFLASLSDHLGMAIRNAMLYQASEENTRRLEITGEIAKAVSSSLKPDEIFKTIIREIRRAVPCGRCVLASLDQESRSFRYWHTSTDVSVENIMADDTLARWLIENVYVPNRPFHVPDNQLSPSAHGRQVAMAGLRSTLFIPIDQEGRCVAHLALSRPLPDAFTREDETLLASIASHVGPAIRNAMLYQASEDKTSRLEVTGEIAKAVSSSLEPEEIFRTITREIRRAIPCERCVIATIDDETGERVYRHVDSDVEAEPLPPEKYEEVTRRLRREVYESKRPFYIPDIVRARGAGDRLAKAGFQSTLIIPILQSDRCVAHLSVSSMRANAFTKTHEDLLIAIAGHVGPAIRNAKLYGMAEERASRLEVAGQIAKAVSSSLEPEDIFRTITREIRRAVPSERCVIATIETPGPFTSYWNVDSDIELDPPTYQDAEKVRNVLIKHVYEGRRPHYSPDIAAERGEDDRFVRAGFRSTLFIPVFDEAICIAHISVSSTRRNAFSAGHQELLASIAAHVGPAIRNAKLYHTAEERASRLEITGEIAKAITSSLEPEEIFRIITREIRRAVPCERCVISSVNPQTSMPAYWHVDSDIDLPPLSSEEGKKVGQMLIDKVYRRKEPCYVPDTLQEEVLGERVGRVGLRSTFYIPVLQGEVCIAHITVSSVRPDAFTPGQRALLASAAAHIGPAIRNATLFRTAEERASRLAILNEVNRKISENTDLNEVLMSIVQAVTTLLRADHARIFMVDPPGQDLVLKAAVGTLPWPRERRAVIPPRSTLASWVFENEKAALLTDLQADPRWKPMPWEWIPQESVRSAVCQPLTEGGRPTGVILGLSGRKEAFTPEDLALLGDLASQASIVIEKALRFAEARERAVRLGALNQLTQKIIATHSLDEILNALLQAAAELLRSEPVHIFLLDEAANRLTLRASYGAVPMLEGQVLTLRPGEGASGRVFETGVPANLADVQLDSQWVTADWVRDCGIHSFISHPMTLRGKNIGVINCLSDKVGFFTGEDLDLLGALASQAAIAIEKTSLLGQAEERATRLELTGEIARALNSSLEPEQIFRIIVREIRRAVPCERCVISRVDPATRTYQYLHVESDVSLPPAPDVDPSTGTWLHDEVYQTMRPKFVPDLTNIPGRGVTPWSERLAKVGLRSLLIIPIPQDGQCVAHFALTARRESAFSREQIDLLTSIAQHVGSAVRNASLYRTAEQRASRLLVLNRLNRHITENLTLDETLGNIVHAVYDLLDGDLARLYLIDEASNRLTQRAAYGNVPMSQDMVFSFSLNEGISGSVAKTGEPTLVPDVQSDPRWRSSRWARENDLHAFIAQPLRQGGRIIGVLNCVSRKRGFFSASDLEFLSALASQAAIAVQNARLHDEEKRSREFLNSVVGDTSDPIVITNLDRIILLWNSGAEELYGYSESEALGRNVDFIVPEDDAPRQRAAVARVIAGGIPATYETRRRRKDGGLVAVTITLSPVQDERGEVAAIAGIHKDLSEWKRAERALQDAKEEAEAANRAKSVFLSNLNHELRSPLNVVTGLSDILRLQTRDAETGRVAQKIREAGEHMLHLIEDLLDIDRIATGKLGLQARDAAIDSLVRGVIEARIPHMPEGFSLESDLRAEDCQVRCDPTRIRQILINLLDNAVKYSPAGGTIRVRTERRPGEVWISVKDQGIGIDPAEATLIFRRFAQLESGGAHRGGGLGIGLHLVQQLLGLQGGRIWVEGAKGAGSTFTFSLPLSPQPAAPAAGGNGEGAQPSTPSAEGEEPWGSASVLVIEGQMPFHGYLRMLMRNAGRLLSARTEEEGLEAARKERPDLILIDLEAPQAEGLQFLKRLKSLPETRDIPIVAVSPEPAGAEADRCQTLGVEGFVPKPIDPVAFRLEIGRVLSAWREKRNSLPARKG